MAALQFRDGVDDVVVGRYVERYGWDERRSVVLYGPGVFHRCTVLEGTGSDGLGYYLRNVEPMAENEVQMIVRDYAGDEVLRYLQSRYRGLLRELAALILWIDSRYGGVYGKPELGVAFDPEVGHPVFITVTLPGCRRGEWRALVKETKSEMARHGLRRLRREVVIVCHRGLREGET